MYTTVPPNAWLPTVDLNSSLQVAALPTQIWDPASLCATQEWIDPSSWIGPGDDAHLLTALPPDRTARLPTPQKSSSSPSETRSSPPTHPDALPDGQLLLDLTDIYFERVYPFLPVLHKAKLKESIRYYGVGGISSSLVLAIAAVAANFHHDGAVRDRQAAWFGAAKALIPKHMHIPDHSVQTLQAAALTIYQAMVEADFATSWFLLGEAWRKAVAMGSIQCDGIRKHPAIAFGVRVKGDWIEKEEVRRVLWALYICDRGTCFSIGLVHAIDDRRLRISFPVPEHVFQGSSSTSEAPDPEDAVKFGFDLTEIITAVQAQCRNRKASTYQLVILGYILLGSIGELLHAADFDYVKDRAKLEQFTAHLVRIRLLLPTAATDLSAAKYDDFPCVLWLNITLSACTVLLHHHPLKKNEHVQHVSYSTAVHWPHCVAAARDSVSMIRQVARSSTQPLMNAHIPSLLFSLTKILIAEYFDPAGSLAQDSDMLCFSEGGGERKRDAALSDDLEVLLLVYTRLRDGLDNLGVKFYKGFAFWMRQGPQLASQAKAMGSLTLLHTCEKWPAVSEDEVIEIPP